MTVHAYDLLKPLSDQMLPALAGVLAKGEADAKARGIEEQVLMQARLAPDMFDFRQQVDIACDLIKGGFSRLAGQESPSWGPAGGSFADLAARVQKTIDHVGSFSRDQLDGSETRDIVLNFPGVTFNFKGEQYLLNFVVPNFYFHITTAYAILRHNGVGLGKKDYLGG